MLEVAWEEGYIRHVFMTFIAVCILAITLLTYTLHPTRLHAGVSEAGRIYAEAAWDRV